MSVLTPLAPWWLEGLIAALHLLRFLQQARKKNVFGQREALFFIEFIPIFHLFTQTPRERTCMASSLAEGSHTFKNQSMKTGGGIPGQERRRVNR